MLEKQPHHIRKKIALICTLVVAAVLVAVLVLVYSSPRAVAGERSTKFKDFFRSISEQSGSLFNSK